MPLPARGRRLGKKRVPNCSCTESFTCRPCLDAGILIVPAVFETPAQPIDEHVAVARPQFGLINRYRLYRCKNCAHVQLIATNHTGECIDYCGRNSDGGCSWKPSFGNSAYRIPFREQTYRPFDCVEAAAAEVGPF